MADHLSRLESNEVLVDEKDIKVSFSDELVMVISHGSMPWYADYAYYVLCGIIPEGLNRYQRKRFLFDVKKFFWDELYVFREFGDHIIWICVPKLR